MDCVNSQIPHPGVYREEASHEYLDARARDVIATHDVRSPEDIERALKELFGETLPATRDGEVETVGLFQPPGWPPATPNRRHPRHPKPGTTEYGDGALAIPRDRAGSVTPVVVLPPPQGPEGRHRGPHCRPVCPGDEHAGHSSELADLYGVEISPALGSNLTNRRLPRITAWHLRPQTETCWGWPCGTSCRCRSATAHVVPKHSHPAAR